MEDQRYKLGVIIASQSEAEKQMWHEVMKDPRGCPNLYAMLQRRNAWRFQHGEDEK